VTAGAICTDRPFMQDLASGHPYERLLHAALNADHRLFAREDGIEETWRSCSAVGPPGEVIATNGSWGPDAARELLRGHRGCNHMASRNHH